MFTLAAIGAALRRVPAWVWVAALLLGAGWYYGHTRYNAGQADVQAKWDESLERGRKEVERLKSEAGRVTVKVETEYVERIKTVRVKGETIVKQVPVYVPAGLPELPGSLRVFHDAASQGAVPDASQVTDASPVPVEDLAAAVAYNYTQCLATSEQLRGLQEWVSEQQRINP